ncbi:S-adenosyl-L-methionine-dependent methyltransferase [Rickenella mellea]|uniref:S-adenosyl-L-methionine-dependent methyltransferase n=1 Tax=Rickenella mellea TaxID=50990 RepID=A0A4Y7PXH8_9AGAM|nr:S-adenosyl-L-methionine-dependent methyltransferase [Rickenella mellea]
MDVDDRNSASNSPVQSVNSYRSSQDGERLLRNVKGRQFAAKNESYLFPSDENEFNRLKKNHLIHLLKLGKLYVEKERVQLVMAPVEGDTKRILDLGTGSGCWAIGMANEFSHAEVVGVDLAPDPSVIPRAPINCRFEFDDINLGLEHFYDMFDIVHCRELSHGISDFPWLITEAAKCLKPGGMILVADCDCTLLNEHHEVQAPALGSGGPGESWLARALFEWNNVVKLCGCSVEFRLMGYELMHLCPLLDDAGERFHMIPIGPWQRGQTWDEIQRNHIMGRLMRETHVELISSMEIMFSTHGFPRSLIQRFKDGTKQELNDLSLHLYEKWVYSYAMRNNVPHDAIIRN